LWRKDSSLDLMYWFFTGIVSKGLSQLVLIAGVIGFSVLLGRHPTPGMVRGFPPIANQPTWAIVMEVLILGDSYPIGRTALFITDDCGNFTQYTILLSN